MKEEMHIITSIIILIKKFYIISFVTYELIFHKLLKKFFLFKFTYDFFVIKLNPHNYNKMSIIVYFHN